MKRFLAMFLAVLMLVALMAGCGGDKTTDDGGANDGSGTVSSGSKTLNVACIAPLTGPAARSGEEIKNAVEMQFENYNYTVGDYQIKLYWVDSQSDSEKSAMAYEECIMKNDIDVGFMDWHSWVSVSCMEVASKYKIPHFFAFGAGEEINNKIHEDFDTYKYWVGKAWPTALLLTVGYVETINQAIDEGLWTPRNKNFGIYGVDQDWGRSFGGGIAQQLEDTGWTKSLEEWFQLGETDFYPLLTKMQQADVSLVCGTMSDLNSATAFVKQANEVGLKSLIVIDGLGWLGEWYDLTGEASNFVIDQMPQFATEEAVAFKDAYTEKYGFEPAPSTSGMAYDWTAFFIKVIEKCIEEHDGEVNNETMMQTAEDFVITGELAYDEGIMHDCYKFTEDTFPDPVVGEGYYIFPVIQYFDGVGVPVWPASQAQQELKIPDALQG